MGRPVALLLAVALLTGCGGSNKSSGAPSTVARTTSAEDSTAAQQELLYGCIEPNTARPVTVESGGVRLDAALFGDGRVGIVLAHERGGSLCNWASIAPDLADAGYRVLIFDFGEPATVASDMFAATKKIDELGAKKVILGGASLGGTAALIAAARERRVVGAFSLSAPAVFGNAEALPAVRRFHAPVLFVAAAEDSHFAEDARQLYRASASLEKELLIVSGFEHGTDLYGGPAAERVRRAVDRLLAEVAP